MWGSGGGVTVLLKHGMLAARGIALANGRAWALDSDRSGFQFHTVYLLGGIGLVN